MTDKTYDLVRPADIDCLRVEHDGKALMTFHPDGRITVSEDAEPSETAKHVIECMRPLFGHVIATAIENYRKSG